MAESLSTIQFSEAIHGSGHYEVTIHRNPGRVVKPLGDIDTITEYFQPPNLVVILMKLIAEGCTIGPEEKKVLDKATIPLANVREFRRMTNTVLLQNGQQ